MQGIVARYNVSLNIIEENFVQIFFGIKFMNYFLGQCHSIKKKGLIIYEGYSSIVFSRRTFNNEK